MNNLAAFYQSQGQYDKAEPLYVACQAHRSIALGGRHPHNLQSMSNLGGVYYFQGHYEKAQSKLTDCLKIQEVVLDFNHPDTINTRNILEKTIEIFERR